jgi:hypothetical protein
MKHFLARTLVVCSLAAAALLPLKARGEAMLQYFNTDWNEIAAKIPELAEAGYSSLWLPPPTKGSGGLSVGYDLWDRFDLGSKEQRGSVRTRYGTEAELLRMIEIAHRFGIRVYFDNIMNHNAFDVPGFNASTPIDIYPGFVPEDFHLRVTPEGFYRKWDNTRDWNSEWQVMHLGLADLIDIANEPGPTNHNFGATEGSTFQKIKFVRHPNNPEYYCYKPDGTYVGFGPNNGITVEMLQQHSAFYSEYVEDMLHRSARWLMDRTKADGLRLDAVKHTRADFFGATFGADKDFSDYGYLGQAQRQFNLSRGFSDPNHRDTVFDTEKPRDDAMMFGEHLGQPPPYGPYWDAGMRLVDNDLRSKLNDRLGNPSSGLNGLDQPGSYGFAPDLAVMHAQSHDSDYAARRELQHALYFTRAGLGLIYTDGNYQAQTLGQSGGAFPRHANTAFLGQFGDSRVPDLLKVHDAFARGYQLGKWSDADFVAYERLDKRENPLMPDSDAVTMLFMMNDNFAAGQGRTFSTSFPATAFGANAYLYNYSTYGGGFYKWANEIVNGSTIVPPGGYFIFSWRTPETSDPWSAPGGQPITILQNGQPTSTLTYIRRDGPDGDPNFNPYNVPGAVPGSYAYPFTVPRVTNGTSLSFVARADGSAENILIKLDGGVDLNNWVPEGNTDPGKRDHPPALATDTFLGYEQPTFIDRTGPEKFAAINTARNTFGSAGAETYTAGGPTVNGTGTNPQDVAAAAFLYHDPNAGFEGWGPAPGGPALPPTQFHDNGSTIDVWAKTNSVGGGFRMFFYYTTDGSNPEGAAGVGLGTTRVAEMNYQAPNSSDGNNWWGRANFPRPQGTIKYKIGIFKTAQPSQWPGGPDEVARKKKMLTTFQVANFNATTAPVYPHNDYGVTRTGLAEGFHVVRARAFLKRDESGVGNGRRASLYNTFTQTFYYDAQRPTGEIRFPQTNGDTVGGQQYGVVVRTDPSVTEVWYKIVDSDANNDDTATGVANGNNAWVKAIARTPSLQVASSFPDEWRFNYVNIPATGTAQILVRLRELSSADSTQFSATASAADDEVKHYTTLVRTVNTAGPDKRLFVAFPQTDGETIGTDYKIKIRFSKSLADGTNTEQLINRFLIKIASSESASPANGVPQSRELYQINYNVTNDLHELQFPRDDQTLPNVYNDIPDFLHTLEVTYTDPTPGSAVLETRRLFRAQPVPVIKNIIVTPPEIGSDGRPHEIVLPDVANPTPEQRQVPIRVETDATATSVVVTFSIGTGTVTLNPGSPTVNGNTKFWDFTWQNVQPGSYVIQSVVTTPTGTATTTRNARVIYRQVVPPNEKNDIDDDGLGLHGPDAAPIETTQIPLPQTNSETWTNAQVHVWAISGRTDPFNPDSDGDVLSDGLELGWGAPVGDTDPTVDTNGDGVPNFQPDLDPPIFNTTDNWQQPPNYSYFSPWPYNLDRSRTDLIAGTMTDPNKPDTDDDGVNDGMEDRTFTARLDSNGQPLLDANGRPVLRPVHNGRVDILPNGTNSQQVIRHPPTIYNTSRIDRARVLSQSPNAMWIETDPNNPDSDGDGLRDGQEDQNRNGIVDLAIIERDASGNVIVDAQGRPVRRATLSHPQQFTTVQPTAGGQPVTFYYTDFTFTYTEPTSGQTLISSTLDKAKLDAVFRPGGQFRADRLDVIWLETDPRRFSTSGDSLPDGWKVRYGLDPFDSGAPGTYNLNTGAPANPVNGPNGNPSGDGVTTNLMAYINGTDPRDPINAPPPPAGAITIGPVPDAQTVTVGSVVNRKEFTDWTADDLLALDPYHGDGYNNQQTDIYRGWDGFDSSRDLVAFYARDGGATAQGGDGNFYFRVDIHDLQPFAEQGNLDIYVVVNFGQPGTGEFNLPDQVDTGTAMGWQAVVAVYESNNGRVYLWDQNSPTHSTAIGQDLAQFGVTFRDQNAAHGFKRAYFDSQLDAVEFSISRQALLDAGWNGNPAQLNYQVFTTKSGTGNNPRGAGDIGGRSDIRDSIRNDWIASDYYLDQPNITGNNSVLRSWIGVNADNDRGKRVKVISTIHGNQAIQPGSVMQDLINNSAGGGYYRALDVHQAFSVPLTLHITPTLASAIQWAKNGSGSAAAHRDGPAFNARIGGLMSDGVVSLLGTTFSDHMMAYFDTPFNADNVQLANSFLTNIYGHSPSPHVFWTPERVSSGAVLQKVKEIGYSYTFADQLRHVFKWFGRTSALGNDGYRINAVNGTNFFSINDGLSSEFFRNDDNGLTILLRQLLSRKARDGQQDQTLTILNHWEDYGLKARADAYDLNMRWLANRPWVQIVTPDQIVRGEVPYTSNGSNATHWGSVNRGTGVALANVSKDYLDHATQENYDHWYFGSAQEEGLRHKTFSIRTGVQMPDSWGLQGQTGVVQSSWHSLGNIIAGPATIGLQQLGRTTMHASVFLTAFHNQRFTDLSKFSTGAYINPDPHHETLAGFSKAAQSQTRYAAVYARVNSWAAAAASGTYFNTSVAQQMDVDLDGENEYLLFNDRIFALFERIGGRMTAAWLRDIDSGYVTQVVGNFASYSGTETEEEGAGNFSGAAVNAYRTSGFKDWFSKTDSSGAGTFAYVNNLYTVTAAPTGTGWRFTSADGKIVKTINLDPRRNQLQANYTTSGMEKLYVRFGLSPDLLDLLQNGQANLTGIIGNAEQVNLFNHNSSRSVRVYLQLTSGATYNPAASDRDTNALTTVLMRNQAQTQQVEIGGSQMTFALGFETGTTLTYDSDSDGIPDWWTQQHFGHPEGRADDLSRAGDDADGDGLTNLEEYVIGTNPLQPDSTTFGLRITRTSPATVKLEFGTIRDRVYRIYYRDSLQSSTWTPAGAPILGTGSAAEYIDNGSSTGSPPTAPRFYKLEVSLQ